MKYFSDKLNRLFDDENTLNIEEEKFDRKEQERIAKEAKKKLEMEEKNKEREADLKKLREAKEAIVTARSAYNKLLDEYAKKYQTYDLTFYDIPHLFSHFFD